MNGEVVHEVLEKCRIREHMDVVQKHFFLTDECFARAFYGQLWSVSEIFY